MLKTHFIGADCKGHSSKGRAAALYQDSPPKPMETFFVENTDRRTIAVYSGERCNNKFVTLTLIGEISNATAQPLEDKGNLAVTWTSNDGKWHSITIIPGKRTMQYQNEQVTLILDDSNFALGQETGAQINTDTRTLVFRNGEKIERVQLPVTPLDLFGPLPSNSKVNIGG